MNVEIRPVADVALRRQVERAVRPVRARRARKLVMREELFAHLTAIYSEERMRQPDDQAAVTAALARFGQPAALTAELNTSVGLVDRVGYRCDCWEDALHGVLHFWFGRRAGEAWFGFALRVVGTLAVANMAIIVAIKLASMVLVPGWSNSPAAWPFLGKYFVWLLLSQVVTLVALRAIFLALYVRRGRWRWIWASAQAVLWTFCCAVLAMAFRWEITGAPPTAGELTDLVLSWGIGKSPFLVLGVCFFRFGALQRKQHEIWTTLAIDG
jgi:hypothetical protein